MVFQLKPLSKSTPNNPWGRHKVVHKSVRGRSGCSTLTARGHPQPQRQMAVAVVIDHLGCERLPSTRKSGGRGSLTS